MEENEAMLEKVFGILERKGVVKKEGDKFEVIAGREGDFNGVMHYVFRGSKKFAELV